jgi:hypothetical protein
MCQLVQLLLDHGAHLDQPNRVGDCPAIFVAVNPLNTVHLVNYVTLRCLAATAVCKHKIPYKGQIPVTLETFVKFHEEWKSVVSTSYIFSIAADWSWDGSCR